MAEHSVAVNATGMVQYGRFAARPLMDGVGKTTQAALAKILVIIGEPTD
jgi:hypothetical protein